jgi:hypothetical protein
MVNLNENMHYVDQPPGTAPQSEWRGDIVTGEPVKDRSFAILTNWASTLNY